MKNNIETLEGEAERRKEEIAYEEEDIKEGAESLEEVEKAMKLQAEQMEFVNQQIK